MATHISVPWPADSHEGRSDGIHIANSEVGVRSVTNQAIVYRPACANILPALGRGDGEDNYRRRLPSPAAGLSLGVWLEAGALSIPGTRTVSPPL
jgi:hypothetical protein